MKTFRIILFGVALSAALIIRAPACDLCGCYTPQLEALPQIGATSGLGQQASATTNRTSWTSGIYLGLAEQFTHFGTLQIEGREVANPTDQFLDSSITQLVIGRSFGQRFGLQVNIPFIYRSFERPEGFAIDRGTESGVGDVSLLGKFVLLRTKSGGSREVVFDDKSPRMIEREPDFTASIVLLAGLKLPTGDSSRIKEEFNEIDLPGAPESGIHGHDLTLGTGSYDGIFGGQTSLRYRSLFFQADLQFTLRGDGLHQYHFANDLSWSGGPGYYLVRRRDLIVGLQSVVSGEHKDVDRFRGERAEDTGITSVFLGPRLLASWRRFSGELGVDVPLSIDNTSLQAVPDYRVRAGFAVSF